LRASRPRSALQTIGVRIPHCNSLRARRLIAGEMACCGRDALLRAGRPHFPGRSRSPTRGRDARLPRMYVLPVLFVGLASCCGRDARISQDVFARLLAGGTPAYPGCMYAQRYLWAWRLVAGGTSAFPRMSSPAYSRAGRPLT